MASDSYSPLPRRFSSTHALQKGWVVESATRATANLNLESGPPIKISPPKWKPPPLGWSNAEDVISSAFIVRSPNDLPSHAVNVAAQGTSSSDLVTPADESGWKVALNYSDWDDTGYGTFYWNASAGSSILNYTFKDHDVLPSGVIMRQFGDRVLQAFITGSKPSASLTHCDETSSLLYVVSGSKCVWIAPPGVDHALQLKPLDGHPQSLDYNPDLDSSRDETVWHKVILDACDGLFIPKGWYHYVRSCQNTVALSVALSPEPVKPLALKPTRKRRRVDGTVCSSGSTPASCRVLNSRRFKKKNLRKLSKSDSDSERLNLVQEADDTSTNNWCAVKWVKFDLSKRCQRWPAAVLTHGQMVYINVASEEAVEVHDYTILEDFLASEEDIQRATGGENLGKYVVLKRAIDVATSWVQNTTRQ